MSTMSLRQQLLLAHTALERNWVCPTDLYGALQAWKEGSLADHLLALRLLTPDQVRQIAGPAASVSKTDQTGAYLPEKSPPIRSGTLERGLSRYVKVRPHARGGLGEVFVARDEELQREVALKEIQSQFADHSEARSRFVREAEITGNLEHPGVVPIYGLGAYPDGRPYYAMRFIKGEGMDAAIKRHHQNPADTLVLRHLLNRFVAVCNAVGFAHSRGVIHRDIKPANIMLGDYGETLLVDWGLARVSDKETPNAPDSCGPLVPPATEDSTTETVQHGSAGSEGTQQGQALGTIGYMPPEQARGDRDLVGPGSDIFSLGATLYALLTGQAPYQGRDALVQACQGTFQAVRTINKNAPRALEAICARAMAREPADRYATARDLGQEVERFLADEPVQADREPVWDRMRRWSRKHRTLVSSGVGVLLVSVVGLVIGVGAVGAEQQRTARQRDKALRAEEEANDNLKKATANLQRALVAEQEAQANLKTARENLDLARKAVNDTFDLAKDHRLFQQDSMREARKLLLEKALPFYQRFRILKGNDAAARVELAFHAFQVGEITNEIGDKIEARRSYVRARELVERLVKDHPDVPEYRNALANTLHRLGRLLQQEGKRAEARQALIRARDLNRALTTLKPNNALHRRELASTLNALGILLKEEGDRAGAYKAHQEARDLLKTLADKYPANVTYRSELAATLCNLGVLLSDEGKRPAALLAYSQSRAILQALIEENPTVSAYRESLTRTSLNLGMLLLQQGNHDDARKTLEQATAIGERLVKDNPKVTQFQHDLARVLNNLALVFNDQARRKEAIDAYTRASTLLAALVKSQPNVLPYKGDLAVTLNNLGNVQKAEGKTSAALETFKQARELLHPLVKANPRVVEYRHYLMAALANLASLQADNGKPGEALKNYLQARDIVQGLIRDNPEVTTYKSDLTGLLNNIGNLYRAEGKFAAALSTFKEARKTLQGMVKSHPKIAGYRIRLAAVSLNQAVLYRQQQQFTQALAELDVSLPQVQAALKIAPRSALAADLHWRVRLQRAWTLEDLNRYTESAAEWREFALVAPTTHRLSGRIQRTLSLARAGLAEQAMTEAIPIVRDEKLPAGFMYQLACVAALSCKMKEDARVPLPQREHQTENYATRAIACLKALHKAGYFKNKDNVARLLKDGDFATLRQRVDFKAFLAGLPTKESD